MLVVGLVEGCLSLSEMEPLTVRSPLTLYDPGGGGGAFKAPPPSDFLLSRI